MPVSTESPLDDRLAALFASDPEAMADPYPLFGELRERGPVYDHPLAFLAVRYAEARTVVRDPRFGKAGLPRSANNARGRAALTPEQQRMYDEVTAFEGLQVNMTDPPEHDRLRKIAHRAFTPTRIAALRDSIERYTEEMLEPLRHREAADLAEFAYTLPLMLIADMLGVPQADRELIHEWSDRIGRNKGPTIEPGPLAEAHVAVEEFRAYVRGMLADHRRAETPVSDLVAALIDAEEDDRLSPDELASMFVVLLFAGHETTTNLIGTGTYELLRHRDQWEAICAAPERSSQATEELLRYLSPVQWTPRVALERLELGGVTIEPGDRIFAMLAAANRDPEVFHEPDRLDILRPDTRRHIAFGFGPHFCLGASLTRLEGSVALAALARRFPRMELATDRFRWRGSSTLRGLVSLPVRLGPS